MFEKNRRFLSSLKRTRLVTSYELLPSDPFFAVWQLTAGTSIALYIRQYENTS